MSDEPAEPITVVVADDSTLLRSGIVRALSMANMEVVGEATDADELLLQVDAKDPDLAVIDIRMPPTHTDEGLRAAATIRERQPQVGLLVLSQYLEPAYAADFFGDDARGKGYLLKQRVTELELLVDAVRRVATGGSAIDPEVVAALLDRTGPTPDQDGLTSREREVLALMSQGLSNVAIVDRLVVSPRTVEGHVAAIYRKLGLTPETTIHRRVQAVLSWLRMTGSRQG